MVAGFLFVRPNADEDIRTARVCGCRDGNPPGQGSVSADAEDSVPPFGLGLI